MTTFGETLKHLREPRRISQSKLAERAGFDHSYVSRLETGSRMPARDSVVALARALEATPKERTSLMESAGFTEGLEPDVEAFRRLPPELRRAALEFIEKVRAA